MKSNLIEIACEVRGETAKAWRIYDGDKKVWLPKSQVEIDFEDKGCVAIMPEWLAQEKELI